MNGRGADAQAVNGRGKTAMEVAVESNFRDNEVLSLISDLYIKRECN